MTWDRNKWIAENAGPKRIRAGSSENPTPEKERAAVESLRDLAATTHRHLDGDPNKPALVHAFEVRNHAYNEHGQHLAHALWLADFLESVDVGVRPWSSSLFSIEAADKLAAPYEDYSHGD